MSSEKRVESPKTENEYPNLAGQSGAAIFEHEIVAGEICGSVKHGRG